MRAALFDLDGTLLSVNSGTLWVREEWREGTITWRTAAWATWWIARYSMGHADMDHVIEQATSMYSGHDDAGMMARVRTWFDREVRHKARPGALTALARHREAGDRLVLATTSSVYAARLACEAWGLDDAICTRPEVVEGRLTGRLAASAFGPGKLREARAWGERAGIDLADCTFYTDSYSDRTLLEAVGEPVAIHPDRRLARLARERGWRVEDWGRA